MIIDNMHVGFTGTQNGLTDPQEGLLLRTLGHIYHLNRVGNPPMTVWFHHGDCVGADEKANDLADKLGYSIVIHPSSDDRKRAFCKAPIVRLPLPYLKRNAVIVQSAAIMIACPATPNEIMRSGTWATIRYARAAQKPLLIINPDGSWKGYDWEFTKPEAVNV